MLSKPKSRTVATLLAFSGVVTPIAGLHKFYLGQYWWGLFYILLSWTPIPRIASAIEGVWYLAQEQNNFDSNFNLGGMPVATSVAHSAAGIHATEVSAIAEALRQLDQLRQDGLITEYEFEQKRRQWLDRMA